METISELLKDRNVLKRAVVQCFRRVADKTDNVNINGLQQFRSVISQVIQVPVEAFGDLVNTYICFDFDGSGQLEVNEVYKLVKFHLREYRKMLGGEISQVDMPVRTIAQAGYNVTKELGRGSQGIVRLATNREGTEVCIKCLEKRQMSASGIEELQEEFQTLQTLACERIAVVYELFQDPQFYYMVGEPYHGGDFMTLKSRARSQGVVMTENWLRGIFLQCFEALEFMHEQAMIHCDIKEPNIMLKTSDFHAPEVVLIDFGVSKAMATKPNGMPGGTPGYMPPETLDTRKWFPRGDIFSMGVVIIQVMCDKIPPLGARTVATPGGIFVEGCLTIQDIMNATKTRQPPFHLMPPAVPGLTKLIRAMLTKQMQGRPTAPGVLKDEWFALGNTAASSIKHKPRPANKWATVGITKSFLARPSVAGEALSPAEAALRELHKSMDEEDDDDSDDEDMLVSGATNVTHGHKKSTADGWFRRISNQAAEVFGMQQQQEAQAAQAAKAVQAQPQRVISGQAQPVIQSQHQEVQDAYRRAPVPQPQVLSSSQTALAQPQLYQRPHVPISSSALAPAAAAQSPRLHQATLSTPAVQYSRQY